MEPENKSKSTKQIELNKWLLEKKSVKTISQSQKQEDNIKIAERSKPKLAFGFGYDPSLLKNGIFKYSYSHDLEDGIKLFEFEPKLSYRVFNKLAKILNYKCTGSELRKGKTVIKSKYFVTDRDPEEIIHILNKGINELFENYEPI